MLSIIALLIGAGIKACFYALLLWIMIKIQKLNYTALGLLLCSGVATLISLIPLVGPYLAYAALLLCLHKVTRADIYPDCVFTAVVANSVMLVVNLWLLGALMGDLRPDLMAWARPSRAEADTGDASAADAEEQEEKEQAPVPVALSEASAKAKGVALKGIAYNRTKPTVMLRLGTSYQTLTTGEVATVRGPDGVLSVRCEQITNSFVVLKLDPGERVRLDLK